MKTRTPTHTPTHAPSKAPQTNYSTLAFRGDGPFRAAICRDLHDGSLKVRLERLNIDALAYELVCEIAASEYAQVLCVLNSLVESIPEAARAITLGRGQLPWEAA